MFKLPSTAAFMSPNRYLSGDDNVDAVSNGCGGARIAWTDLPFALRLSIEKKFGARVISASTQHEGFSPGLAVRACLTDGRRAFVKAVSAYPNVDSPLLHRREAFIAANLPQDAPVPRLLWAHEEADWVVLAFDDIDGVPPRFPWHVVEVERVLKALTALAAVLTPSPIKADPLVVRFGDWFYGWRTLASGASVLRLDPWSQRHLHQLVTLESTWEAAAQGDTLLHADLRADNILLTPDGVMIVDWPWACIGAPWFDLLLLLVNVAALSGPSPDKLFLEHPLGAKADPAAVDAMLAALAGFFTERALAAPEPGLPRLRQFQHIHACAARAWLAARRGWEC